MQVQTSYKVADHRLLKVSELATYQKVAERAARKWVCLRRIPVLHPGQQIQFELAEALGHVRLWLMDIGLSTSHRGWNTDSDPSCLDERTGESRHLASDARQQGDP